MAGPIDIDDDMQCIAMRKGDAGARGGYAFQRLLQLAETRNSGQRRVREGKGGGRPVGPDVARGEVTAGLRDA